MKRNKCARCGKPVYMGAIRKGEGMVCGDCIHEEKEDERRRAKANQ